MEKKLLQGNNLELLKTLESNSIDSVVTDPPYGLSFMNKKWDYDVPSVEFWKEVYRVLKPGGHILSFGGTRTYHRMVVNIEDAGFEIRDQIMWLYGSGFPKSLNIGKDVDKKLGNERELVERPKSEQRPNADNNRDKNKDIGGFAMSDNKYKSVGNSEWEGWGTGLKPANEPICLARKPISENTIAENVLKWGTGGINVDGCRVGSDNMSYTRNEKDKGVIGFGMKPFESETTEGRFPANIILECICDEVIKGEKGEVKRIKSDGGNTENRRFGNGKGLAPCETNAYTDKGDIHTNPNCPCYIMDKQSGESKSSPTKERVRKKNILNKNTINKNDIYAAGTLKSGSNHNDKGGASRFFYQAKVSKSERNMGLAAAKNNHPTVKPINLMTYLCRLITPKGGTILDAYMGSGSTGIAALLEGFNFIGMEMDEDYFKIASSRINNYEQYRKFIK